MTQVYALLKEGTALTVFREASQNGLSRNPVVRSIIDNNIGFVSIANSRPQSDTEERVIRVQTTNPEKALKVLKAVPGIEASARSVDELIPDQRPGQVKFPKFWVSPLDHR